MSVETKPTFFSYSKRSSKREEREEEMLKLVNLVATNPVQTDGSRYPLQDFGGNTNEIKHNGTNYSVG